MAFSELKRALENNPKIREYLFVRGFLVTDNDTVDMEGFPFYSTWEHHQVGKYHFYTHPLANAYFAETENGGYVYLLGHAYNPFTMEHEETPILEKLAAHYGKSDFYDCISELTGVFVLGVVDGDEIYSFVDPSGMQSACQGMIGGKFYLSSHPQLIADITDLKMDPFVADLIEYKWYSRVMGAYLPADLTPYCELKRIVPSIEYVYRNEKVSHKRFYPIKELSECKDEQEYQAVIENAADILKNNMTLIARKWKKPAISLTGGIDSNTTFAAANGNYDKFETFSYLSAEKETIDCTAAKEIASHFNVPWTLYEIPQTAEGLENFDEMLEIIKHNNGYIVKRQSNEYRKRVYLAKNIPFDVEVKSWVSETIRAYWYKHYGRKKMPPLSAKLFRNLYKIFILNRGLAHKIDKLFEAYIEDFEYKKIPSQYPPADTHFNEVTWGSWGGLGISEMKMITDITFAYNNRMFLDLLFRVPLEQRISDKHHLDMKKYLNPELFDMNIHVVNMRETDFRAAALNVIFTINSFLPF